MAKKHSIGLAPSRLNVSKIKPVRKDIEIAFDSAPAELLSDGTPITYPDVTNVILNLRNLRDHIDGTFDFAKVMQFAAHSTSSAIKSAGIEIPERAYAQILSNIVNGPYAIDSLYPQLHPFDSQGRSDETLKTIPAIQKAAKAIELTKEIRLKKLLIEFEHLIENATHEGEIQTFLNNHTILIDQYSSRISKQKLGSDFITDLVLIKKNDQGNTHILVELEKCAMPIFTKKNEFTTGFNHAYKQIIDWANWMDENKAYLQTKLSGLSDIKYQIIAGRSKKFSKKQRELIIGWNRRQIDTYFQTYDDLVTKFNEFLRNLDEI